MVSSLYFDADAIVVLLLVDDVADVGVTGMIASGNGEA